MKIFVTADHHFGDDRFKIMQRPFESLVEMHGLIIENHNKVVGEDDLVIFNGDVAYKPEYLTTIDCLAGKKILIRGNHDAKFSNQELEYYFDEIIDEGDGMSLEVDGIPLWITHYPTQSKINHFNLVGHIHSAWKIGISAINVGVDVHHFKPVPLDDIPFYYKAIKDFYDEDVWVGYSEENMKLANKRKNLGSYLNAKM